MRLIINKILVTLLLCFCSAFSMWARNDYARHLEIMSQTNILVGDKKIDEAMSILRQNKDIILQITSETAAGSMGALAKTAADFLCKCEEMCT